MLRSGGPSRSRGARRRRTSGRGTSDARSVRETALSRTRSSFKSERRAQLFARESVAPVEVARAAVAPERGLLDGWHGRLAGLGRYLLDRLLARPDTDILEAGVAEVRFDAVHRLFDSRLL